MNDDAERLVRETLVVRKLCTKMTKPAPRDKPPVRLSDIILRKEADWVYAQGVGQESAS